MNKNMFEDELVIGMQRELVKQASFGVEPNLAKAAECLHAALEIFEEVGLEARADQVLQVLEGISKQANVSEAQEAPSLNKLMEAGITQRDMHELSKGNPVAKAKVNLVLRQMGMSDHAMGKVLGPMNVMSEEDAKKAINPNQAAGAMWGLQSTSQDVMQAKHKTPSSTDVHTKGLTPEKEVENYKKHGIPFNMADDCAADDLMNMEIQDDALEVSDQDMPLSDFEDEKN